MTLLDVREPEEYALARIELDPTAETVVVCHEGLRSVYVAELLDRALRIYGGLQP